MIDVADPANPREVGLADPGSSFRGVAVSGDYAYVASYGSATDPGGLLVIDISDPANPQTVASHPTSGRALEVVVSGRYAYVIDINDPLSPQHHGRYSANLTSDGEVNDIAIAGDYAYVTIEFLGLQVIDLSDPANPRRVARYETGDRVSKVAVAGNYAYVSGYFGLEVIDVSNPTQLRSVGSNRSIALGNMVISGGHLVVSGHLVASGGNPSGGGLIILDLFRPLRLEPVGRTDPDTFRLRVDGPRGVSAWVQRSTDLTNWDDWRPVTFGASPTEISAPETAAAPPRFYRGIIR